MLADHHPPAPVLLQRVREELEALKQQAPAVTAAPAPAAVVAPAAPAKEAAAAPAEEEEEEGGSAFAALNLVGILAAGGLYGYQTIQKKEAAEAEAAYQAKLEAGEALGHIHVILHRWMLLGVTRCGVVTLLCLQWMLLGWDTMRCGGSRGWPDVRSTQLALPAAARHPNPVHCLPHPALQSVATCRS